ncbi:glutaminyl-peptide cyclotransferase [Corynebacterium pseudopelargi]|nr:glutaminyl-peptide cyclotransferase [Corynebacterium pseudopelargi]
MPSNHRLFTPYAIALCTSLGLLLGGCQSAEQQQPEAMQVEILETRPFDPSVFTQGIEVTDHGLLVSSGMYGQSSIFYRDDQGNRLHEQQLEPELFGEGSTQFGNTVWQLTWRAGEAIERDATTLEQRRRVQYEGEGWGLCSFDDVLVMSDGTSTLRLLDPHSFEERTRLEVQGLSSADSKINELACVQGDDGREVYANVFLSTNVLKISLDDDSAELRGLIDASSVPNRAVSNPDHVLNGIANIPGSDEFWITGKRWPDIYRVRFH